MNPAASLLAPLLALLPVAGPLPVSEGGNVRTTTMAVPTEPGEPSPDTGFADAAGAPEAAAPPATRTIAEAFRAPVAQQVRIEQRVIIRIAPRAAPVLPSMLMDLPPRPSTPRYIERKIGKCLAISGIAGVQVDAGNSILLYMRDRRIVSAALERACRARDFYSGFYVAPTADGQLCVDRDALQSRSGASCRLSRIRQLIDPDD